MALLPAFPFRLLLLVSLAFLSRAEAQSTPSAASSVTASQNYRLAPDDVVEIKVFQEDDLTTQARISHDGLITFPLLGSVKIGGRSVREAGEMIRQQLGARFLVNPQVNLTVVEHARRLFTVLGQVQRAGTYKFPDRESLNLLQAIGMAGGYSRIANPGRITLKRRSNGQEVVLQLDGKRMAKDGTTPFNILPGDMITVGERLF